MSEEPSKYEEAKAGLRAAWARKDATISQQRELIEELEYALLRALRFVEDAEDNDVPGAKETRRQIDAVLIKAKSHGGRRLPPQLPGTQEEPRACPESHQRNAAQALPVEKHSTAQRSARGWLYRV